MCHHMTRSVAMRSRPAGAVIVAVVKAHLIGPGMIKPGDVEIDIGINQVQMKNLSSRLVEDVDTEAVKDIAGWITPAPGGVGPVTVAILLRNATRAHARQQAAGLRS